jgi:Cd2+/Zn2+-exporting ATPase
MTRRQKKTLTRILIGAIIYALVIITVSNSWLPNQYEELAKILLYVIPYLIIGGDVLFEAFRNIIHGSVFDENFLMCIATLGAFGIRDYKEAVAVMLFYQIGELFQSYAVNKSRKSIAALMDIRPDYANIEVDGELKQVDPEEVAVGDIIVVKPGERIPLDGVVISGNSFVDTSALTGEAIPREVMKDSTVISGCINKNGVLSIRVEKEFGESTVSKILDLVENASSKKAKTENFITRFARYYTPVVVISAALLAIIPPVLFGQNFSEWLGRALIFLVISCPCALVISVPLGFFGGIGAASKNGILVKGSNYLEALAKVDTVVFDKTGTLTKGNFVVTDCIVHNVTKADLLETAALAESYSDHPISISLKRAINQSLDLTRVKEAKEIAGQGVQALVDENIILCGNEKLMQENHITYEKVDRIGTIVYVARNQEFIGAIVIADELKEEAALAIKELKSAGVTQTVMLTGDMKSVANAVAVSLNIDTVYAELLPQDKVEKVEELLSHKKDGSNIAFVGDGINDAPVLSRADVGIAMGGLGADAAIEAADVVLMDDAPTKIASSIYIARKTLRIVKQNIVFALGVKAFVVVLGAFGDASMWDAVFADVGVSVIAILNATRALSYKRGTAKS